MNNAEVSKVKGGSINNDSRIKTLAVDAMFIALTMVFTAFINIQLPASVGGLIHLGNIPLFIAAMLFGRKTGAIAGAVGMGMFDLMSGWGIYAPCTFIVVGLMGYTVGIINEKNNKNIWKVLALVIACVIKVAGYYIYEAVIYKSFVIPVASIPGNITQIVIAAVITMAIIKPLGKAAKLLR